LVRQLILEGTYQGEGGKAFPVWRAAIDTAGSEYGDESVTMTEDAYQFLRQFGGNRLYGSKGMKQRLAKRMNVTIIDKMPKTNQPIPGGITLWLIDTDSFKDVLHYRLQVKPGDPGGITFHSETQDDLAKHILAEEKRKNKKGETEWIQINRSNHLLDCLCLALAMGDSECWGGVKVLSREQAIKPSVSTPREEIKPDPPEKIIERLMSKPKTQTTSPWMGNRKGWIK
jgi:phage terminase large subunit GpA-like protein